jgi:hypothetical protein
MLNHKVISLKEDEITLDIEDNDLLKLIFNDWIRIGVE